MLAAIVSVSDAAPKFCGGIDEGVLTDTPEGVEPTQNAESRMGELKPLYEVRVMVVEVLVPGVKETVDGFTLSW